jgi:hypothetical protein
MSLLTTELSTAIPTRNDLWRTALEAFKVVKLPYHHLNCSKAL